MRVVFLVRERLQGNEFIVRLPLMAIELADTTPLTEVGDARAVRPLRVLVVDDYVDTVLSFSILLRASGHDVFFIRVAARCECQIPWSSVDSRSIRRRARTASQLATTQNRYPSAQAQEWNSD